jgi:hypothetical protein
MQRGSDGGETARTVEMKSNAVRKVICESTRDSAAEQSEIKWAN